MSALPEGTVTFLFSDVEGSTRLLHELGPARYAEALGEHRRIVREAAAAHGDLLGDIVISVETAARQAKRGLYAELLHLASHGLCHLLGYDHRDDPEEATMNARASALRREAARTGRVRAA